MSPAFFAAILKTTAFIAKTLQLPITFTLFVFFN